MFSIKHCFPQNKNKGFTLIELILTLGLSSIVVVPLIAILNLSINSCSLVEERDELILNGNYALEYIKDGIKSGDKIIASDNIRGLVSKYPTNIGFVIMTEDDLRDRDRYYTYYTNENKLIRIGCETKRGKYFNGKYPSQDKFKGFNTLCQFIESIDKSNLDIENSTINLDLKLKYNDRTKLDLKSEMYIRCEIDY